MSKKILYISFDVETDGPVPIINNMLSIGMVGLVENTGEIVSEFYSNIEELEDHECDKQCMETFWLKQEQKEAWDFLQIDKKNYIYVFELLSDELKKLSKDYNLTFVAHPSCFDWMFFKCYYELAKKNSHNEFYDIGYDCTCSSTLWKKYKKDNNLSKTEAINLYKELSEFNENLNHYALEDAKNQGKFFIKLLKKFSEN